MFGKKEKKLTGQDYIDFYESKMKDTGKTSLGEKARYFKEKAKLKKEKLKKIQSGG